DRGRKAKRVSNAEWTSPSDPDSRIAKLKDGRTHLADKAEHAVDLASGLVVAAAVHPADAADSRTLPETVATASENVRDAGAERGVREVVTDKGYHKAETLADFAEAGVRQGQRAL
ncbi:MAG TPA: transposase, partial [Thermoanaerobaculia bacterium]